MPTPSRKPPQRSAKADGNRSTLRIIGGKWRGRKLPIADVEGLRPTGDRIRETLFNWLMADIPGCHCLDLFAGSGALGLEAISRGAGTVVLCEKSPVAAEQLRQNLQALNAGGQGQLVQTDSLQWLRQTSPERQTDIVFVDPPFQANLWAKAIEALEQNHWLKSGSAIYMETPRDYPVAVPSHWNLHREKKAGQVCYRLFYCE